MITTRTFSIALCFCVIVLFGPPSGTARDKKITKEQIPAAVLKAFESQYPHATITGQAIEKENGKEFYEIESTEGSTKRDLLYTAGGKVVEIEEAIDAAALPEAVRSTIAREYKGGKIVKAEKVTHNAKTTYEVQLQIGKKTKAVDLDALGKVITPGKKGKEAKEKDEGEDEDDEEEEG